MVNMWSKLMLITKRNLVECLAESIGDFDLAYEVIEEAMANLEGGPGSGRPKGSANKTRGRIAKYRDKAGDWYAATGGDTQKKHIKSMEKRSRKASWKPAKKAWGGAAKVYKGLSNVDRAVARGLGASGKGVQKIESQ